MYFRPQIRIAAAVEAKRSLGAFPLEHLHTALREKGEQYKDVVQNRRNPPHGRYAGYIQASFLTGMHEPSSWVWPA